MMSCMPAWQSRRAVDEFETDIIVPRYESYYKQVMERVALAV
jgi:CRISPR/Cas system CMR subunit Cmr6 (Cas7 group RAMP superfamily)